ncbi:MAG: hypothetical protein EBZ69_04730 [Alphaproteobacteria bacterium]|nr:hypothetical protein [Alphaproteobacteria bacterium]NDC56101.1 hypothetical protein [Alphaproteobacteria bacterium]
MHINQITPPPQAQNLPLQQQQPQQQLFQAVPHQAVPMTKRASEPPEKPATQHRQNKNSKENTSSSENRGRQMDRLA